MSDDKQEKTNAKEKAAAKSSKGKVAHEKKGSIFTSKPAIMAYLILGLPIIALLLWYAYNVAYFVDEKGMRNMEAKIQAGIESQLAKLRKRAKIEGFRIEDYEACKDIQSSYTTPKGYDFADAELNQLIGMPRKSSEKQRGERCVTIAKAVYKMAKTSHHT
ncbi:MAG: hypothetical protein OQJ97_05010, partial [Rhodospirillales bacterium]|nr:hypothetical protein [Rhodospirillales bacterium]